MNNKVKLISILLFAAVSLFFAFQNFTYKRKSILSADMDAMIYDSEKSASELNEKINKQMGWLDGVDSVTDSPIQPFKWQDVESEEPVAAKESKPFFRGKGRFPASENQQE